ncbi:hypothetical protein BHE74_00008888 [Ensete ventricosum]|nr:hypothetical protein GW17_00021292 [Ensete ventricosum]RWW82643.1 hypothetical protein BHE74_00008888 [Ensete ventricosum]
MWSRAGVATEEGAVASAAAAMEGIMRLTTRLGSRRWKETLAPLSPAEAQLQQMRAIFLVVEEEGAGCD